MKDINAQIQKPQQVSGRETDKSIVSYLWIKTVEPKKNFLKMQTEEKKSLFSKEKIQLKKKEKNTIRKLGKNIFKIIRENNCQFRVPFPEVVIQMWG